MSASLRSAKDIKEIVNHARMSNFSTNPTDLKDSTNSLKPRPIQEEDDMLERVSIDSASDDNLTYEDRFTKKGNATFGSRKDSKVYNTSQWEQKFRKQIELS